MVLKVAVQGRLETSTILRMVWYDWKLQNSYFIEQKSWYLILFAIAIQLSEVKYETNKSLNTQFYIFSCFSEKGGRGGVNK